MNQEISPIDIILGERPAESSRVESSKTLNGTASKWQVSKLEGEVVSGRQVLFLGRGS
jgi:hypothetical protein